MRRLAQVLAADHVRDALQRIVPHRRQMIARAEILAREHDIAVPFGLGAHKTGLVFEDKREIGGAKRGARLLE